MCVKIRNCTELIAQDKILAWEISREKKCDSIIYANKGKQANLF